MRSAWTAIIVLVLSVLIILLAVGQIFFAGGEAVSSETALLYTIEEDIPFTGVYLRDETLIQETGTGVLNYEHSDGNKVGVSSVIARRYKNENEIDYRREIETLKEQIAVLENAEKLIGTDDSQLEAISSQINEQHSSLISCIISGDYSGAASLENSMLEALCKREITLGESSGYAAKKAALEDRIAELSSRLSGDVSEIYADGTGYFVSKVDGYEGELGFSDIDGLTAERILEIIEKPVKTVNSRALGKLIADYTWRAAAVIDTEKMFGIYEGSRVKLRVGSDASILDADVVSVSDNGDGTSLYIFECDRMTETVVQGRTAQFKLVANTYGGLRVSRSAIRYNENNERGVFIINGSTLAFRKIDVVYWDEDYVICAQNHSEEDVKNGEKYLRLYDTIVTQGKDLYDGKVVK